MANFGSIAGALAGAGRGYEAAQGRNIPGPAQNGQQNGGLLMQYLRNRHGRKAMQGQAVPPEATASASPSTLTPPADPPPDAPPGGPPMAAPNSGINPVPMPNLGQAGPTPDQDGAPRPSPNTFTEPMMGVQNRFAQGQVVSKPTTAILGEDGPEAVIPLNGRPDAKLSTANLPQMQYRRGGC